MSRFQMKKYVFPNNNDTLWSPVLKELSRVFLSCKVLGIYSHVTHSNQSRATEDCWRSYYSNPRDKVEGVIQNILQAWGVLPYVLVELFWWFSQSTSVLSTPRAERLFKCLYIWVSFNAIITLGILLNKHTLPTRLGRIIATAFPRFLRFRRREKEKEGKGAEV